MQAGSGEKKTPHRNAVAFGAPLAVTCRNLELPGREEVPLALAGAVLALAENECFSLYKRELPFTALSCFSPVHSGEPLELQVCELIRQELAHGRITDFLEYGRS